MPSVAPIIRAVGQSTREMFNLIKSGNDPRTSALPSDFEHLRSELLRIAETILLASRTQYWLDWDSKTYNDVTGGQDGGNPLREQEFRDQFRPLDAGRTVRKPCSVVDKRGRVEVLYLPDMISPERQTEIRELANAIKPCLERNGPKVVAPNASEGWRQNQSYFRKDCEVFAAGLFTASPGWQMRGHETKTKGLYPSKDLATLNRKPSKTQSLLQDWVAEMKECALILSAALAVAHPEQFEANVACLDEMCKMTELADLAGQWAFAFNVVSVISNRATPEHRDKGSGGRGMLDLLLSIGGCPRTTLELPGLGLRFGYDSGTTVLFSGHVHLHTVSQSERERMCIACYSRKAVYHKFGLDLPGSPMMNGLLRAEYAYIANA